MNNAVGMDCKTLAGSGYVAIVNWLPPTLTDLSKGSLVYQLRNDQATPIQYFTLPRQSGVKLLKVGNDLYMIQTFQHNAADGRRSQQNCPIMKLTEGTFSLIDAVPCVNAMRAEPFIIETEIYLAIANRKDVASELKMKICGANSVTVSIAFQTTLTHSRPFTSWTSS